MARAKVTGFALGLLLLQALLASPRSVRGDQDFHDNNGDGLVDDALADSIFCQSSDRSPKAEDVLSAVNHLKELPSDRSCCQNNCQGSKCTTMSTEGSAATDICSFYVDDCDYCFNCNQLATLFDRIGNECISFVNGEPRIGGSRELHVYERHFSVGIFNYIDA